MFNVHIEMPSGAVSKGYDRATEAEAQDYFEKIVKQLRTWKGFVADVVMLNEIEEEVKRERIVC